VKQSPKYLHPRRSFVMPFTPQAVTPV